MGRVISTAIQFIDGFTRPSAQAIESMKKLGREIQNTGKQIQNAGKTISSAGATLTKSITLPISGVATTALKMSNDFENAMAKVGTIADTTNTPMAALKEQVLDLSNAVGVGVTDIAEAQYQAISAGVDTAASVDFVSTAVKAAKGGFTDTATAVDGLTTVLNAYGFEAGKAAEISDQMLLAQNFGKTSFGDMASSMGKVIPIASSLNVSTEELFGSIAVLTKNGIATSEAVNGLKAAYSNILKPSADASKTAQQLGLDFSSAHLQSVGWAKFLDEIKEKTGGNAETMAKLFGSTEALNSVTVLAGKGSADFTKVLGQMGEAAGMTQTAYEKMLTPTERMNISFNKIKNSLIQFGTALTPAFNKVAEIIGKAGDKLNNLSEGQVHAIVKIAAIAAAVGPAILIFGKMVTAVGTVTKTFGTMVKAIANFGGMIGVLTSPAGIVIGILAAIALAAAFVVKNWDKMKPAVMNVKKWFLETFGESIKQAIIGFQKIFVTAVEVVKAVAPSIGQAVKKAVQASVPVIQSVAGVIKSVLPSAIQAAKQAIAAIAPVIQTLIGIVIKIAPIIGKTLVSVFQKLVPVIKLVGNVIKAAAPVIANVLSHAFDFLGKAISKAMPIINRAAQVIGGVLLFAIQKAAPVVTKLAGVFSTVLTAALRIASNAVKKLQPVFTALGSLIKSVMGVIGPVVGAAFHAAVSAISAAAGSIKQVISGITKVFEGILDFVCGIFTANWRQAWEGIKTIFSGAFESLAGLCKTPINAVIGIINSAISGLNSISITIPEWVPGLGGKSFGVNLPTIPLLYKGTDNWKGGMAMIHDRGGEIVDLPRGSRVYPHDKSVEMARKEGERSGSGSISINIQKLADKIEVRSDEDIDRIAEALAYKLKKIAFNTGTA